MAETNASAVPEDTAVEYCRAIWQEVCSRSGRDPERTCSSADFDLMFRWYSRRIPLRIVLRGIADTKGKASTVSYYRAPVEAAIGAWAHNVGLDSATPVA